MLLLVGDLYQLPPVITNDEIKIMSSLYPNGHFFFNSNVFKNTTISKFELTKIYRQDDQKLIKLLDKVKKLVNVLITTLAEIIFFKELYL